MPNLTLRFKDIKIRDYSIAMGHSMTIGRKHSNDIVIDNLAVSGNHARIEPLATNFVLRDLGSTNGTFVNGQQVAIHNLRHNDVVGIGNHELLFEHPESLKPSVGIRDDYQVEKTRIIDTSAYRDTPGKTAPIPGGSVPAAGRTAAPGPSPSFFSRWLKRLFG